MEETNELTTVVGVRFKRAGKIYYFDPGRLELRPGDHVVVETARGNEYGRVVLKPQLIPPDQVSSPLRRVVRIATQEDREQVRENKQLGADALRLCTACCIEHGLDLRVIDVEYTLDRSRVTIYFTAEEKVELQELAKNLAGRLGARLEFRQIGVRDEAKLVGGLGPCGRILCCTSFLPEFAPVSIRMAKDQDLSLSPSKLTGLCGRLKCCLRYENDVYVEARALLPREGAQVLTNQGAGRVVAVDFLGKSVTVRLADDTVANFSYQDVSEVQ